MKKFKTVLRLFLTFLKIGLFTFGGGYAMIALIEREFVARKKYIDNDEFSDMIAIAESTPGPLAINSATYIGYKIGKGAGAAAATIAVCIPSFVIIYVISLFFNQFLRFKFVQYAFKGIQAAVALLILTAGLKMFKNMKKNVVNFVLMCATVICMLLFTLFAVDFSSVFYILIGGVTGIVIYLFTYIRAKIKKGNSIAPLLSSNSAEKAKNSAAADRICAESSASDDNPYGAENPPSAEDLPCVEQNCTDDESQKAAHLQGQAENEQPAIQNEHGIKGEGRP